MRRSRYPGRVLAVAVAAVTLLAPPSAPAQTVVPTDADQIRLSYAPVVRKAAPAVVNIYAQRVVKTREPLSPLFSDPFFRRFFGGDFFNGVPRERVQNSLGSGVIVRPTGLILTNHHVIAGAEEITVVLADRRERAAKIVLSDPRTDMAVLRIDTGGEALPYLTFGDSDALEVGDLVLAIGNPFGVGQSVTSGIVSANARSAAGISDYQFFIQTDAAINPGNSGGALVAMDGRLVGINTAIYSRGGGSVGIGFAIPANMAAAVLRLAESGGTARRPWLGASGQTVTAEIAAELGMKRPDGVLINAVWPGGPADAAGLRVGDVVLAVGGKAVSDIQSLRFRIATQAPDGPVDFRLLRAGREIERSVRLEPAPETPPRDVTELTGRHPLAGATVGNLSPAFAEELGVDPFATGVIIVGQAAGSPAARFGFRPGDVIQRINGTEIARVTDLVRVLAAPAEAWNITFGRDGRILRVAIGR